MATASPPSPPDEHGGGARRDHARAWGFLGLTTVVVVILGLAADSLTEEVTTRPPIVAASDTFARPDHDSRLGLANTGQQWTAHSGTWGIRGGAAAVTTPEEGTSVALVPVGVASGRVQVEAATMAKGLGLAFRCRNPFNCWKVEAVPEFATWNVVKIVDGHETVLGNLGRTPVDDGTTVAVDLDGEELRFSVDGVEMRSFRDRDLMADRRVGLSLREPGAAATARWTMFRFTPPPADRVVADEEATVRDDFGAPSGSPLARTEDGTEWQARNGAWSTRGGFAVATRGEARGRLLALLEPTAPDLTFEARVLVASGTGGIAFRCRDAENCWVVEATGGRAQWRVVKIVDGVHTRVTTLGAGAGGAVANVAVRTEGERATFFVDGERRATVDDPALAGEAGVGLVVEPGRRVSDVAWDRVALAGSEGA